MKTLTNLSIFIALLACMLRADALPEHTLKAAYLYNFALLTQWPQEGTEDFRLCFYREDLGAASDALKTKTVRNKNITTAIINTPEEARNCQLVFIRETEEDKQLPKQLFGLPVLIVGESPKIGGSHITILSDRRKLAFDVNLIRLEGTQLAFSSRLLKLARRVNP